MRLRRARRAIAAGAALLALTAPTTTLAQEEGMLSQTPVLLVEEVEPCLGIWETLGFERTMEVAEGDRLGFVAMERGGVQIMYQSRASVANDMPALAEGPYTREGLGLFIRVESLEDVIKRLKGVDVERLFAERTTFYGSREIGIRTPCGTNVVFAEFAEPDETGG